MFFYKSENYLKKHQQKVEFYSVENKMKDDKPKENLFEEFTFKLSILQNSEDTPHPIRRDTARKKSEDEESRFVYPHNNEEEEEDEEMNKKNFLFEKINEIDLIEDTLSIITKEENEIEIIKKLKEMKENIFSTLKDSIQKNENENIVDPPLQPYPMLEQEEYSTLTVENFEMKIKENSFFEFEDLIEISLKNDFQNHSIDNSILIEKIEEIENKKIEKNLFPSIDFIKEDLLFQFEENENILFQKSDFLDILNLFEDDEDDLQLFQFTGENKQEDIYFQGIKDIFEKNFIFFYSEEKKIFQFFTLFEDNFFVHSKNKKKYENLIFDKKELVSYFNLLPEFDFFEKFENSFHFIFSDEMEIKNFKEKFFDSFLNKIKTFKINNNILINLEINFKYFAHKNMGKKIEKNFQKETKISKKFENEEKIFSFENKYGKIIFEEDLVKENIFTKKKDEISVYEIEIKENEIFNENLKKTFQINQEEKKNDLKCEIQIFFSSVDDLPTNLPHFNQVIDFVEYRKIFPSPDQIEKNQKLIENFFSENKKNKKNSNFSFFNENEEKRNKKTKINDDGAKKEEEENIIFLDQDNFLNPEEFIENLTKQKNNFPSNENNNRIIKNKNINNNNMNFSLPESFTSTNLSKFNENHLYLSKKLLGNRSLLFSSNTFNSIFNLKSSLLFFYNFYSFNLFFVFCHDFERCEQLLQFYVEMLPELSKLMTIIEYKNLFEEKHQKKLRKKRIFFVFLNEKQKTEKNLKIFSSIEKFFEEEPVIILDQLFSKFYVKNYEKDEFNFKTLIVFVSIENFPFVDFNNIMLFDNEEILNIFKNFKNLFLLDFFVFSNFQQKNLILNDENLGLNFLEKRNEKNYLFWTIYYQFPPHFNSIINNIDYMIESAFKMLLKLENKNNENNNNFEISLIEKYFTEKISNLENIILKDLMKNNENEIEKIKLMILINFLNKIKIMMGKKEIKIILKIFIVSFQNPHYGKYLAAHCDKIYYQFERLENEINANIFPFHSPQFLVLFRFLDQIFVNSNTPKYSLNKILIVVNDPLSLFQYLKKIEFPVSIFQPEYFYFYLFLFYLFLFIFYFFFYFLLFLFLFYIKKI